MAEAFREVGLEPTEQPVPGCGGANILAPLRGAQDRWVLVAAHYDHLGREGSHTYHGADDNAAAVAIMVEVARALRRDPPKGRGVLFAAFDGEEPPYFLSEGMGSEHFALHPTVPLNTIDLMVCMDLVGHAIGPEGAPEEVRQSVFALGAERSEGTAALVERLARVEPGVILRRFDAETVPPLSDYWGFWRRNVPFLFLTNGRWRYYHTPEDTPDKLDYAKIEATARWLERLVREACARPEPKVRFLSGVRDDASTLRSLMDLLANLESLSPMAALGRASAEQLLARCDASGRLADAERAQFLMLVGQLERGLA
ncbi:M28 family metallopeptidase [Hyalangium versicolor]|uniref:M28 family metallopeptidase n=1 Tax=Hyalangium versicolor TaxID=2861190 RepID=UPI001CCC0C1D|nr:M28 family peptidase [Hyalangium versicolor]